MHTWLLVVPVHDLEYLSPLVEAHRQRHPVKVVTYWPNQAIPSLDLDSVAAVLWVGDCHRSPRTALTRWWLTDSRGRKVPVGWLPDVGSQLATVATTMAQLLQRVQPGPLIYLSSLDSRSQTLIDQVESVATGMPTFRWTSERILKADLLAALGGGAGAALYTGHGFSTGWNGYGGLSYRDLDGWQGESLGVLWSITCHNASRHQTPLSFAETLVLSGRCGAVLAAPSATRHRLNQSLIRRLPHVVQSLVQRHQSWPAQPLTLADCLTHPRLVRLPLQAYRIIGDPLAPLHGSPDAVRKAQQVFAPAASEPLPPLPPALWGHRSEPSKESSL